MTIYLARVPNQTPYGLFTNLYPTNLYRMDRAAVGGWYLATHAFTLRLSLYGRNR